MRAFFILLSFVTLSACKPSLIPNSSLRDNYENRIVMDFVDCYREATNARSVDEIMALVADDFFEQGGTTGPGDKYGYAQLKEKLTSTFARVESLDLKLHVQKIEKRDDLYDVYYYFVERAQVKYPADSHWVTASDFNRMVLRMKGTSLEEGFEIVSGL